MIYLRLGLGQNGDLEVTEKSKGKEVGVVYGKADKRPHINGHAGDANAVSTVCSDGNVAAFVESSEAAGWAPLMAVPFCGSHPNS